MPNANITTLVTSLSVTPVDATATNTFQDDVIFAIARREVPGALVQVSAEFIQSVRGQASYTVVTANGQRVPLMICADDTQLALAGFDEAQSYNPDWRAHAGPMVAYLYDPVDRDKFEVLFPPPASGDAVSGSPVAPPATWPAGVLTVFATQTDLTYAAAALRDTYLPVAFETIAREYGRDSDHRDPETAMWASKMAQLLWMCAFPGGNGET